MGIKGFFEKLFGKSNGGSGNATNGSRGGGQGKSKDGTMLTCVDCKQQFVFETGEQEFFKMRGLTPPKRCPRCRTKRKHRR